MKYHYEYFIYANNMCWGYLKVGEFRDIKSAQELLPIYESKYGCCDIVKKRVYDEV